MSAFDCITTGVKKLAGAPGRRHEGGEHKNVGPIRSASMRSSAFLNKLKDKDEHPI